MIGDLGKEIIVEQGIRKPIQIRMMLSFKGTPLPDDPKLGIDSEFFLTNGLYYVRYAPSPAKKFADEDFFILVDFLTMGKARLANYRQFTVLAQTDPKFAWLLAYTNINKRLFDIARRNINMPIPFCFDAQKYADATGNFVFRPGEIDALEKKHYTVGHFDPRYRAHLGYGANKPYNDPERLETRGED